MMNESCIPSAGEAGEVSLGTYLGPMRFSKTASDHWRSNGRYASIRYILTIARSSYGVGD